MGALLPWIVLSSMLLRAGDGASVPAESVTLAADVHDPVFAYLVGLVDGGLYGMIDAKTLEQAVQRADSGSQLPYQHLRSLTRTIEREFQTARIDASFDKGLSLPIPYRILGYSPGRLRSTQRVSFHEWILGEIIIAHGEGAAAREVRLSDVHLFAVRDGTLRVDIDGWLDALLGGKLDDTRITGLVLFRWDGERWGIAVGYNEDWGGRSGLLSLREDEIRFPSPPPMKTAAWKLRQILEGLEPSLRPDSLRAHPMH